MSVMKTALRWFSDGAAHSLLMYKHWSTGEIEHVNGHDGMGHSCDYKDAIGMGKIAGHSMFRGFGRRADLSTGTGGNDIWDGVAVAFVYPNQTTGEQMTLISTSANDTSAGSGVQQVEIHYLDAAGAQLQEVVTLNGTLPVNTVATNIRFVQFINAHRVTAGSIGTSAAGDITIYSTATPAKIYNIIRAGGGVSLSSQRMVPAGVTFYLSYMLVTGASSKPLSVRLSATCNDIGELTSGIFNFNEIFEMQDSTVAIQITVPRPMPAFTIIKGNATSTTAGGACSVSYGGWIE